MRRQTFEFWLLRLPHPFNTQNLRGLSSLHYLQCSHSHILRGPDWCRPFATEKSSSGFLWQSVSSKKPLRKAFKTEPRELLGGTEEKSVSDEGSLFCPPGTSMWFFSIWPRNILGLTPPPWMTYWKERFLLFHPSPPMTYLFLLFLDPMETSPPSGFPHLGVVINWSVAWSSWPVTGIPPNLWTPDIAQVLSLNTILFHTWGQLYF